MLDLPRLALRWGSACGFGLDRLSRSGLGLDGLGLNGFGGSGLGLDGLGLNALVVGGFLHMGSSCLHRRTSRRIHYSSKFSPSREQRCNRTPDATSRSTLHNRLTCESCWFGDTLTSQPTEHLQDVCHLILGSENCRSLLALGRVQDKGLARLRAAHPPRRLTYPFACNARSSDVSPSPCTSSNSSAHMR